MWSTIRNIKGYPPPIYNYVSNLGYPPPLYYHYKCGYPQRIYAGFLAPQPATKLSCRRFKPSELVGNCCGDFWPDNICPPFQFNEISQQILIWIWLNLDTHFFTQFCCIQIFCVPNIFWSKIVLCPTFLDPKSFCSFNVWNFRIFFLRDIFTFAVEVPWCLRPVRVPLLSLTSAYIQKNRFCPRTKFCQKKCHLPEHPCLPFSPFCQAQFHLASSSSSFVTN